jgi:hypothetical protein
VIRLRWEYLVGAALLVAGACSLNPVSEDPSMTADGAAGANASGGTGTGGGELLIDAGVGGTGAMYGSGGTNPAGVGGAAGAAAEMAGAAGQGVAGEGGMGTAGEAGVAQSGAGGGP